MSNTGLLYKIAFSMARGMQADTAREMLRRVGSPEAFCQMPRQQLAAMAAIDSDIFDEDYRNSLLEKARTEEIFVSQNSIQALFATDTDFPKRLSMCDDAPVLLYKLGACDLDHAHVVGIVGTRHATNYGIDFTQRLVRDLAAKIDNLVIVSGLAFGIDVAAHKTALECKIPTVGVLAHGLQMIYPAEHRNIAARMVNQGGALVTEYTSADRIFRGNFLARNRIVAGLCDCLVVVESDRRGGSMSTARIARQYNREVFAVPGRVSDMYSRGTNHLIANNTAALLTDADQLLQYMAWRPKEQAQDKADVLFTPLNPQQQQLYDFIIANPEATSNDICVALGLSYAAFSNLVFELEMEDLIVAIPGGRYAPTAKRKP